MCGLVGYSGDFVRDSLPTAISLISHRGPDGSGIYFDSDTSVGLGHVRLSIQDLSQLGHQPMQSNDGSAVLVFNGEIYNFRKLREELEKQGFVFRGHSDSEVVLNLYLRDGIDMLSRLDGIFSFAIWDIKTRTIFIARDPLGVKPLYYSEGRTGFVFASEIKALLAFIREKEIDGQALHCYLNYLWCPAPMTMFKSIKKLEPGTALTVRDGRIEKKWSFYDLPVGSISSQNFTEVQAADSVRGTVRTDVHKQMVSDVPVGAFLSGGLDSSAVTAFAKEVYPEQRLQCFTIDIDSKDAIKEGISQDLPYAKMVAKHLDVDLHIIKVRSEMAEELSTMLFHLDEPQADPAALNVLFISRLAREHGIKVLLSGAGGDDIFTGYRRHRALAMEKYWRWMPQIFRNIMSSTSSILPTSYPNIRRLKKAFQYANLNGNERIASYFYWLSPAMVDSLLNKNLLTNDIERNPLVSSLSVLPKDVGDINKMLYLECKHFLADHNLNYTDKMSMAEGVEVRVPLLDLDVVNLAAQIPNQYKQRGKEGKWIFKKAMEGILPNEIIYRPKTGFGAPLRSWLHGPLKELVRDILSNDSLVRRGWFNVKVIQKLIEQDMSNKVDASYTIFAVLCVE